ncbi:hypothetical protein [Streptomyces sp. NPDC002722]|uniref:hypothetical protein n=1 Tax=unclassified Streptomyces TaxID=2593676 RepID=UPI0033254DFD
MGARPRFGAVVGHQYGGVGGDRAAVPDVGGREQGSAAYPVSGLTSLVREFTFADGVLTLRDRSGAQTPLDITERFMSFAPIESTAPGEALIQGDTAALRLHYDASAWQPRVNHYPHVRQDATGTTVHSLDLRHTGATAHFEPRAHPE